MFDEWTATLCENIGNVILPDRWLHSLLTCPIIVRGDRHAPNSIRSTFAQMAHATTVLNFSGQVHSVTMELMAMACKMSSNASSPEYCGKIQAKDEGKSSSALAAAV